MPLTRWFDGGSLSVCDWFCAGDAIGIGAEEHAAACEVSIGRTGSHALRTAGGETMVEPTHLLCINAGESFRLDRDGRTLVSPCGPEPLALVTLASSSRTAPLAKRVAAGLRRMWTGLRRVPWRASLN